MYVSNTNKNIGNKFVDYLGPVNFNGMSLYLKKSIFDNIKNNYEFKKKNYCKLVIT